MTAPLAAAPPPPPPPAAVATPPAAAAGAGSRGRLLFALAAAAVLVLAGGAVGAYIAMSGGDGGAQAVVTRTIDQDSAAPVTTESLITTTNDAITAAPVTTEPLITTTGDAITASTTPANPATPPAGPSQNDATAEVEEAIRSHWRLRLLGDDESLREAFDYYTGPLRRRAGTAANWARGIRADGLSVADVHSVKVIDFGDGEARARAFVRTVSTEGGCKEWVFIYDMVRVGGRWLMANSTATPTAC